MPDTLPPLSPGLLDLLVLGGLASISTAERLREKVRESRVPIGTILKDRGILNEDQVLYILQLQAQEPHLRLGELAIREGVCTQRDVEEALRIQRKSSPHLLEVILTEIQCDRERLCKVLVRYIRELESRIADPPSFV